MLFEYWFVSTNNGIEGIKNLWDVSQWIVYDIIHFWCWMLIVTSKIQKKLALCELSLPFLIEFKSTGNIQLRRGDKEGDVFRHLWDFFNMTSFTDIILCRVSSEVYQYQVKWSRNYRTPLAITIVSVIELNF